jgi:hypothetical protein
MLLLQHLVQVLLLLLLLVCQPRVKHLVRCCNPDALAGCLLLGLMQRLMGQGCHHRKEPPAACCYLG